MQDSRVGRLFVGVALLVGCLASAFLLPSCVAADPSADAVTVFLVRHAEKGTDDPRDPHLSPEGRQRAEELARMLSGTGVTHLFATEYRRTQETLAPLAEATGVEVTVVGAAKGSQLVERLKELPAGATAVVAGHSNTVPVMFNALGGQAQDLVETGAGPGVADSEYDRLFVVVLGEGGAVRAFELRFGR